MGSQFGLDFDAIVVKPSMDAFGRQVIFYPIRSRPGYNNYEGRGIFRSISENVPTADGGLVSNTRTTLDIRAKDFNGPLPVVRDQLVIPGVENSSAFPPGTKFWVQNATSDGQGAVQLTIGVVV